MTPDERESEATPPPIPEAVMSPRGHWSISLVWIVPLLAVLIGGWAVVHAFMAKGPSVSIQFKTAEGLEAGKTRLKYKDVDIGTVSAIDLSEDISSVIVTAQLSQRSRPFLVEDTRFWVVRPRIAAGAITGLGTLLSGAYIGVDIGKSKSERRHFVGLDSPPVVTTGLPGKQFVLRAEEAGSIEIGSPVYFRHVKVGQVIAYDLDQDGQGVTVKVFVNAPHDRYVTTRTRFWEASGLDIALDSTGVKVGIASLASLVQGGIAFQAPPDLPSAPAAEANTQFTLARNRTDAMKQPDTEIASYLLYFQESLRGLSRGAPVDFHGIQVGEVVSLDVEYDRNDRTLRFPVEINIYPERMRSRSRRGTIRPNAEENVHHRLLDRLVARGLRAQLKTGNLLTGQLFVSLDFVPNAPPAAVNWSRTPAVIPTVRRSLDALQATLIQIAQKLDKVPFDALAGDLRSTLQALDTSLNSADELMRMLGQDLAPEMRATLEAARRTLATTEGALSPQAPLQQDVRETLQELTRAAQALRTLADYLERHPEAMLRGRRDLAPTQEGVP